MKIYEKLTEGMLECIKSSKYKSQNTRRVDICNRYNSSISYVLENSDKINSVGNATVRGCKGFITKSIVDSLNDEDLNKYITEVVCPLLKHLFADIEM